MFYINIFSSTFPFTGEFPVCKMQVPPVAGGGALLFEGRYPQPNYGPSFLALSAPQFSLTAPFFEGHIPPSPQNHIFYIVNA